VTGRIRSLKPEWLEDEALGVLSPAARVMSVALLLLADDYGRGRANPAQLFGQVFWGMDDPAEGVALAQSTLEDLERIGFVELYRVRGQRYFAVRNWEKHQKIAPTKRGKPRVPEPPASGSEESRRKVSADSEETRRTDLDLDLDLDLEGDPPRAGARDPSPPWSGREKDDQRRGLTFAAKVGWLRGVGLDDDVMRLGSADDRTFHALGRVGLSACGDRASPDDLAAWLAQRFGEWVAVKKNPDQVRPDWFLGWLNGSRGSRGPRPVRNGERRAGSGLKA
jgi:hypothetical protein